jgi:hypothetical protein
MIVRRNNFSKIFLHPERRQLFNSPINYDVKINFSCKGPQDDTSIFLLEFAED